MRKKIKVGANDSKTLNANEIKDYRQIIVDKDAVLYIDISDKPIEFIDCEVRIKKGSRCYIRSEKFREKDREEKPEDYLNRPFEYKGKPLPPEKKKVAIPYKPKE